MNGVILVSNAARIPRISLPKVQTSVVAKTAGSEK